MKSHPLVNRPSPNTGPNDRPCCEECFDKRLGACVGSRWATGGNCFCHTATHIEPPPRADPDGEFGRLIRSLDDIDSENI